MWCSRKHLFNIPSHRKSFSIWTSLTIPGEQGWRSVESTFLHSCAFPENIHTPPTEGNGISWGVGWLCKAKTNERNLWSLIGISKIPFCQRVWIFSWTTQCDVVWFWPSAICGLSLFLVPAFLWGFFSWFSGFPPFTKTNIDKFQFDQDRGTAWKPAKVNVWLPLLIHVLWFIHLFICFPPWPLWKFHFWFTLSLKKIFAPETLPYLDGNFTQPSLGCVWIFSGTTHFSI